MTADTERDRDADLLGRAPSHDIDAERYTLAAMMQSGLAVEEACEVVGPGDFYRPGHSDISWRSSRCTRRRSRSPP